VRSRERDTEAGNEVNEISVAGQAQNHDVLNKSRNVIVEDSQEEHDTSNAVRYSEPKSESPEHDSQRLLSYPPSNNGDQNTSPELGAEETFERSSVPASQFVKPTLPGPRPRLNQAPGNNSRHDFSGPHKSYFPPFPPNPFSAANTPDRRISSTPETRPPDRDAPYPDVYEVPATDDESFTPGDKRNSIGQKSDGSRNKGNPEPSDSRTSMPTPESFQTDFSHLNGNNLGNGRMETLGGTQEFGDEARTVTAKTSLQSLQDRKRNCEEENKFEQNSSPTPPKLALQSPASTGARPVTAKMNLERLQERRRNRKEKEDFEQSSSPTSPKPVTQLPARAGSRGFVKPHQADDPIFSDSENNAAKLAEEKRLRKNEQSRLSRAKARKLKDVPNVQMEPSGCSVMVATINHEKAFIQGSNQSLIGNADTNHASKDQHQSPTTSKETAPGASFPRSSMVGVKNKSPKMFESEVADVKGLAAVKGLADEAAKTANAAVTRAAEEDDHGKQARQAYHKHTERQKSSKERKDQEAKTMAFLNAEEQRPTTRAEKLAEIQNDHDQPYVAHAESRGWNENGGIATPESTNQPHMITGIVNNGKLKRRPSQKPNSRPALRPSTNSAHVDATGQPLLLLSTNQSLTTTNKDRKIGPRQSLNRGSTTSLIRRSVSINPIGGILNQRSPPTSGTPTKSCLKKLVSQPIVIIDNSTTEVKEKHRLHVKGDGSVPDLPDFHSTPVENIQARSTKPTSKEKASQAPNSSQGTKAYKGWQPPIIPPNGAGSSSSAFSKTESSVAKQPSKLKSASSQPSSSLLSTSGSGGLSRTSSTSKKLQQKLPFSGTVKDEGQSSKVTKGQGKESLGGSRPANEIQESSATIAISSDSSPESEQFTSLISPPVYVQRKASGTFSKPTAAVDLTPARFSANLEDVAQDKPRNSSGNPASSTAPKSPFSYVPRDATKALVNPRNNSHDDPLLAKRVSTRDLVAPVTTRMSIDSDRAPARYMPHSPSASSSSSEEDQKNNPLHASHSQQTNGRETESGSDDEDEDDDTESDQDLRLSRPRFQTADDELEDALQRDAQLSQKLVDRRESALPGSIPFPSLQASSEVQPSFSSSTLHDAMSSQNYQKWNESSARSKSNRVTENLRTSEAPVLTHAKSATTLGTNKESLPPSKSSQQSANHAKSVNTSENNKQIDATAAQREYWTYQKQPLPPSTSSSKSSTPSQIPPTSAQRPKPPPPQSQPSPSRSQTKSIKLPPTSAQRSKPAPPQSKSISSTSQTNTKKLPPPRPNTQAQPFNPSKKSAAPSQPDDPFPVTDSSSSSEDSSHHTSDDGYPSEDEPSGGAAASTQQNGGGSKSVKNFMKCMSLSLPWPFFSRSPVKKSFKNLNV